MASIKWNLFVGRQGDALLTQATQFSLIVTVILGSEPVSSCCYPKTESQCLRALSTLLAEDQAFVIIRDPAQRRGRGSCLPLHPNRTGWAATWLSPKCTRPRICRQKGCSGQRGWQHQRSTLSLTFRLNH